MSIITYTIYIYIYICVKFMLPNAVFPSSTDYIEESCRCSELTKASCDSFTLQPITSGAGHVALSKGVDLHTQFSCKFTIVAPPHKTVQIVINNISIPETRDCKAGILRVYDGIPGNGGSELTRE